MIINTFKLSKRLTICLVFNILIHLTITSNHTFSNDENNPGEEEDELVSDQDDHLTNEIVEEIDLENLGFEFTEIPFTETDEIRVNIQMGIAHSISDISKKLKGRLIPGDYTAFGDTEFKGWLDNNVSPARYYKKFTFITYGPKAFHHFRAIFHITPIDYFLSFCSSPLRSISNPGASASIFYITHDDKFIMKSVQMTEFILFQKMLPKYCEHLDEYPRSLLPKFSGLYGYNNYQINLNVITMNNILPSNIKIHLKYDLKGSKYNRKASTEENLKRMPTFKDLDFIDHFQDGMYLMPYTLADLLQTIESDCILLRRFGIMDYSLLMGVHKIDKDESSNCSHAASARWNRLMADSIGMESIQADTGTFSDENCPLLKGSIPAESESGDRLLLFVGIIDILQRYRIKKKLEHQLKVITQSKYVSVQEPNTYATRLLDFLSGFVFKPRLSPEERGEQSMKQTVELRSRKRSLEEACQNCFKRTNPSMNND